MGPSGLISGSADNSECGLGLPLLCGFLTRMAVSSCCCFLLGEDPVPPPHPGELQFSSFWPGDSASLLSSYSLESAEQRHLWSPASHSVPPLSSLSSFFALLMDEGFVFDPWTSNAQFILKELLCQEHWETIDWSSAHLGFYHLLAEIHWASTGCLGSAGCWDCKD